MDKIASLIKRRGFAFQSGEIYGGLAGFWDFGPAGTELVRNIKDRWWADTVQADESVVGIDSSIITNPAVWVASGHVSSFNDLMVEDTVTHERFRADHLVENSLGKPMDGKSAGDLWALIQEHAIVSPNGNPVSEPKKFNLLYKTFLGSVEDQTSMAYLRGETCQGIFINFRNIIDTQRVKIPFGIAQVGKAFRNEVAPGKSLFRVREFEQMELEYFVRPEEAEKQMEIWKNKRLSWHTSLGLKEDNLRLRQHGEHERAHYAADSWDIEYRYPEWGFKELEGIANRTDFDLKTHAEHSGKDLSYNDPETNTRYIPFVIEPSVGVSRLFLALIIDAYTEEHQTAGGGSRIVLKLLPKLAPYKAAVFPLVANKDVIRQKARSIFENLKIHFMVARDERGNIGKRYLSQDELGTPWCITVDYETLETDTVTVRDRDTTGQVRVSTSKLLQYLRENLQ